MANKANTERKHFKKRVYERYDIVLNDGEYDYLVSRVKTNDKSIVKFLMKQTNRVTVHIITFKNTEIVVVYDKLRKQLVTALPDTCKDVNNIEFYHTEIDEL